ncbi:MAG: protein kinase [Verrucomicrobiaceae bacterium]|nr:protein kinase [Verrucomicrobiaceae bacterium]
MKPDSSNPPPPAATLDELGTMATIVTHTSPKDGAMTLPSQAATIETSPDMPTMAVPNPSRQLPAATMHSAGTMASMGGKSRSQMAMESISGEDGWISDRYRLLDKLGEGGFGVVYRAEQVKPIHRLVAIKILKGGLDSAVIFGRFAAERQTLALMEHENIARVFDAGETEAGMPYFVMELVKGRSITSYCKTNELDLRHRLELFVPVCQAVHYAHQKSIIHRDLKPANILITDEGGRITPKVIDFGIAKVVEGRDISQADFTGIDQLVGTPGYISPEQIEHGSSHVDTRSDVYALGAILFELLTGKPLVTPADIASKPIHILLREMAERDAPKASSYAPELAGDLDWIVMKALERDPDRRYGSCDDLAEDITRFLTFQPITARPPSRSYLIGRFVRRHRIGVAASAAIAFAVLAGGITSTALYFESEKNRTRAEQASDDLRISYSRSDEQMARQFTERGQFAESVAYLTRSLRTDPQNSLSSTNLLSLLSNVHLMHPITHRLPLPEGAQEARMTAFSRETGVALAVSMIMSERLEAPLQNVRLPMHEVISVWDIQKGAASRVDHPLPDDVRVTCLEITRDGKQAVITKSDGNVELWSLADGKRRMLQPKLPSIALCVALSEDGSTLAVGSEASAARNDQGICHVWNLQEPQQPARELAHKQAISSIDIDEKGELVVVASNEGHGQVWDVTTLQPVGKPIEVDETDKGLSCISLHRDRELVAVGTNGGTVWVGKYQTEELIAAPLTHPGAVLKVHMAQDGQSVHVGDAAGYMHAWNLSNSQPLHPPQAHDGEIVAAKTSAASGLVASVSKHGEVQVWNSRTGERLSQRLQHSVSAVSITDDCSMLTLAPNMESFIQVWNIYEAMSGRVYVDSPDKPLVPKPEPPEKAPRFVRDSKAAAWNRSQSHIIAADVDGNVAVFAGSECVNYGKPFRHPPAVGAVALTKDGKTGITSGRDQVVRVWNVETGEAIAAMPHNSFVEVLALAPDDETLATFTEKGDMRVWRFRTGEGLTPAIRHGTGFVQARVSDDGKEVLFRLEKLGWFTMPMPVQGAVLPEWFLRFAETLAGNRLTPTGRMEELDITAYEAALADLEKQAKGTDAASRIARWIVADPAKRPLNPQSDQSLPDYLKALDQNPAAADELKRFRP